MSWALSRIVGMTLLLVQMGREPCWREKAPAGQLHPASYVSAKGLITKRWLNSDSCHDFGKR